ncbi:hypothetical protein TELCIR_02238 [Teladorsagia circumcincta]|uniref:Uncharacterized protein n=1 Tax=Teladorsagia circumcincta TaxID=45464 RepID=A0A2G9UZN8_TELCI|nr:hypothetical protein TELCIR_02238 [Teladorsagia circumcincta]
MPPEGTPMVYTVNDDPAALEYQPYNNYGVGYWMVQLLMDCTQTQDGWFEFKGFFAPSSVWEPDIQQKRCTGEIGGEAPFRSRNHIARCGAVNVFIWGQGDCIINSV